MEGANHEYFTMGKINHTDDPVDHGVADCDQSVYRTKRQPINQLLGKIFHNAFNRIWQTNRQKLNTKLPVLQPLQYWHSDQAPW